MATAQIDYLELNDLAKRCAYQGGQLALKMKAEGLGETESKSSLTDLVTRADRAVEDRIRQQIGAARPDDSILGEEAGTVVGSSGLRWVVDPIDGTVNFFYSYPGWVVSVAVEASPGEFLAGAIYDPIHDELYDAYQNGGSRLNDQTIDGPTHDAPENIGQALVATGFGYQAERRRHQAEVLLRVLPQIRDIRRGGAAAMDLCHLAMGRVDAYFEAGLNPWDYAAGLLIARQNGCVVEIVKQADNGLDAFLLGARSQAIFDQLYEALKSAGAIE